MAVETQFNAEKSLRNYWRTACHARRTKTAMNPT